MGSGLPNKTSMENDVVIDRVQVVVDTGAEVSVMSAKRFQEIPADKRPHLRQAQTSLIATEAGRKMTFEVGMIMGVEEYVLDMSVAPIADDLLLGCDFLDDFPDVLVAPCRVDQYKPTIPVRSSGFCWIFIAVRIQET